VWSGHVLKLRYRPAGESEAHPRRLGPLGLVLKAGVWYLVAQSKKSIRTYRVTNILDAEITEDVFARPDGFDLAAHWENTARAYEAGVWRDHAEVRLSPRGVALLDLLGPYVVQAARETAKPDRDGWIRCTVPIESDAHGVRELMRLCDEAEVLGPPSLRKMMAATLAAMSGRHRGKPRA
jgi:predicted DNA-binding transcriptional regulator YafY